MLENFPNVFNPIRFRIFWQLDKDTTRLKGPSTSREGIIKINHLYQEVNAFNMF